MNAEVFPCKGLKGSIRAQPSKNYTTRYILVSALAEGESRVCRPADSDDARALISCLRLMGASIEADGNDLIIHGFGKKPSCNQILNPANAGTVLRLLLGTAALLPEARFDTDYKDSLGKRPNQDLLDSLEELGVVTESDNGTLPITLKGGALHGGKVTVRGDKSSQFLSSLLFLSPLIGEKVEIEVLGGLKSKPAVRTTLAVMKEAGIRVDYTDDLIHFEIPEGQEYQPGKYDVNGDWPGTSAILSAAAVLPDSDITVTGLFHDEQGEKAIVDVLREMGADIFFKNNEAHITGKKPLQGVSFDGDKATDAVLAMVGAAGFAEGKSRFYNVGNLRLKECDRISEPLAELCKLGVNSEEKEDEIIIYGNPEGYEGGEETDGRGDHRVIMMLTIYGLGSRKGLIINGAEHIAKSYPGFFDHLISLGAEIKTWEKGEDEL